jgi:hypothetical protein
VQRRASNTGVIMVCGQKVAIGRQHKRQTVTVVLLTSRNAPIRGTGARASRLSESNRRPIHYE